MGRITVPGAIGNLTGIGSSNTAMGPIWEFKPPINSEFSWINQGSTTLEDMGGSIALMNVGEAGPALRIRKKAAPATPYTVDIAFLTMTPSVNYFASGFVWRESSSGKVISFDFFSDGSAVCGVGNAKWNSPTSFNSGYTSVGDLSARGVLWFRAIDDGVNRIIGYSHDGTNYKYIHSVGRTDFLIADEVGFFVKDQNTLFKNIIVLLHWDES